MSLNFENLKVINFPLSTNGNLLFIGVPILKSITVFRNISRNAADIKFSTHKDYCENSYCNTEETRPVRL